MLGKGGGDLLSFGMKGGGGYVSLYVCLSM